MFSEPVASRELKDGVYKVWATADAHYDDDRSELIVELDSFVRPADIRLKETRLHPEWLPQKGRVVEHVLHAEAHDQGKEIFESWVQQVSRRVPETFSLGRFRPETFEPQDTP